MKFVAPEQAPEQAEIIRNTPFWPDVDLSEFRSVMRTDGTVKQPPPQKVYDAVVSFAFNVGTGNACSSTLVKLLNQRRWADACRQLPRWVYVKGVFNQGLDNRRAREMAWCLQGAN